MKLPSLRALGSVVVAGATLLPASLWAAAPADASGCDGPPSVTLAAPPAGAPGARAAALWLAGVRV